MFTLNDDITLARNTLSYSKVVFEKAEIREKLAREEAMRALKEEIHAYNKVTESNSYEEMLPLVKLYGEAVRKNTIATAILNEAYLEMVAKQKALDSATNRLSQLFAIRTSKDMMAPRCPDK